MKLCNKILWFKGKLIDFLNGERLSVNSIKLKAEAVPISVSKLKMNTHRGGGGWGY